MQSFCEYDFVPRTIFEFNNCCFVVIKILTGVLN